MSGNRAFKQTQNHSTTSLYGHQGSTPYHQGSTPYHQGSTPYHQGSTASKVNNLHAFHGNVRAATNAVHEYAVHNQQQQQHGFSSGHGGFSTNLNRGSFSSTLVPTSSTKVANREHKVEKADVRLQIMEDNLAKYRAKKINHDSLAKSHLSQAGIAWRLGNPILAAFHAIKGGYHGARHGTKSAITGRKKLLVEYQRQKLERKTTKANAARRKVEENEISRKLKEKERELQLRRQQQRAGFLRGHYVN